MRSKHPPSRTRRKFLGYLAMSPLLATTARNSSPQPVKSHPSNEAPVRSTIQQLAREIKQRSLSPVELTRDCLARIDNLNPKLNAFITVLADSALADARLA